MASRIYAVDDGSSLSLVRAGHPAQALAHVTRGRFKVRVASQDDIVSAVSAGVVVSDATKDDPSTAPLED